MKTNEFQYTFLGLPDNNWTIIEHTPSGDLDYECELESYDEACRLVMFLRWIEETYSPPRT